MCVCVVGGGGGKVRGESEKSRVYLGAEIDRSYVFINDRILGVGFGSRYKGDCLDASMQNCNQFGSS